MAVVALSCDMPAVADSAAARLELREQWAVAVPPDVGATLVDGTADGWVVAVGPPPGKLFVHAPNGDEWTVPSPTETPLAMTVTDSAVLVLDASGYLVTVGRREPEIRLLPAPDDLPPLSAATWSASGLLALSFPDTTAVLLRLLHVRARYHVAGRIQQLPVGWNRLQTGLAWTGASLVLFERLYPFRVVEKETAEAAPLVYDPLLVQRPVAALRPLTSDTLNLWRALAVLALRGGGTLQTITDLGSDRRLIVRRDDAGRAVSVRMLEIPIGFVRSDPAAGVLVAARGIGALEVVLYGSRWIPQLEGGT